VIPLAMAVNDVSMLVMKFCKMQLCQTQINCCSVIN
jgi:hypothetical protein